MVGFCHGGNLPASHRHHHQLKVMEWHHEIGYVIGVHLEKVAKPNRGGKIWFLEMVTVYLGRPRFPNMDKFPKITPNGLVLEFIVA